MKFIILFLFTQTASAALFCDIKDIKTAAVLNTYEGVCDQRKFGGPWGDAANTVHVVNTTKQKQLDDEKIVRDAKEATRATRMTRIKAGCATAVGLTKDLCDQIADQ